MKYMWILYTIAGSDTIHRMVVVVRSSKVLRSLDDCDMVLMGWFTDSRESVGFYPVSDEECDEMPDNTVFYHV